MKILEAINLSKNYGSNNLVINAVNNIDLKIEKESFTAIMGPSGSGKSTLINMLSGIISPSSGSVVIDGIDISQMSKNELALFRRKKLGFVFQDFNLLDNLTIKENILLPLVLEKKSIDFMENEYKRIANIFQIEDFMDKYPYEVSGGQMQRCAVARAIINNPAVVFADEPTGNLDSKNSKAVMQVFEKLNKTNKSTIMMVTHDAFAASYCNDVIFIKDGHIIMKICKKGTRNDFFNEILSCLQIVEGDNNEI